VLVGKAAATTRTAGYSDPRPIDELVRRLTSLLAMSRGCLVIVVAAAALLAVAATVRTTLVLVSVPSAVITAGIMSAGVDCYSYATPSDR